MAKLVPLEVAPEPLDEEPEAQAIPTPEDTAAAPAVAPPKEETQPGPETYTLPEVPALPIIKEAPKPEPAKPKLKIVPMEVAPTEEWVEPEKKKKPTGVGSSFALVRGLAGGLGGVLLLPQGFGGVDLLLQVGDLGGQAGLVGGGLREHTT